MQPVLALAGAARIARMHREAEGAAIDLRGARLHQLEERLLEPGLLHIGFHLAERLIGAGGECIGVKARFHLVLLFFGQSVVSPQYTAAGALDQDACRRDTGARRKTHGRR